MHAMLKKLNNHTDTSFFVLSLVNQRSPGDAGYLNCVLLQETANSDQKLYAKIGCMERETFTSTKLQLHLYTDNACSVHYDDGHSKKQHVKNGYEVNGQYFRTKVSFRPPFYTCQTCQPSSMSDSFRKSSSYWYDDDYISENGKRRQYDDDYNNRDDDTYFQYGDDAYDPNYVGDDDYYTRYVSLDCSRKFLSSFTSSHWGFFYLHAASHLLCHHVFSFLFRKLLGPVGTTRVRAMVGGAEMMTSTTAAV